MKNFLQSSLLRVAVLFDSAAQQQQQESSTTQNQSKI
jgi:hypothetical protein